uniref:Uncharacterized protein n=1 Tax=Anguilla anguilla TaxID=7936 RepID=A0A0E9SGE5_ANGAN
MTIKLKETQGNTYPGPFVLLGTSGSGGLDEKIITVYSLGHSREHSILFSTFNMILFLISDLPPMTCSMKPFVE